MRNIFINKGLPTRSRRNLAKSCCLLLLLCLSPLSACVEKSSSGAQIAEISVSDLPAEARSTISLIRRNGPFPYSRDGSVFFNREGLLPQAPRGYYREYTVATPGARDRGARRIVSGDGGELYYTADHYRSFSRIRR